MEEERSLMAFHLAGRCYPGAIWGKNSQYKGPEAGRSKVCQASVCGERCVCGVCVGGKEEAGKGLLSHGGMVYSKSNRGPCWEFLRRGVTRPDLKF